MSDFARKECTACHELKPLTDFYRRKSRGRDSVVPVCKSCAIERTRDRKAGPGDRICAGPECDRLAQVKGYCWAHYAQHMRGGPLKRINPGGRIYFGQPCAFNGCENPAAIRGYCGTHYSQLKKRGDPALLTPALPHGPVERQCCNPGCTNVVRRSPLEMEQEFVYCSTVCASKGWGRRHTGDRHPHWHGGRYQANGGYVMCNLGVFPDEHQSILRQMVKGRGVILEHRAVMAIKLGRPLTTDEHVHHINGVKDDNRIENLRLTPNNAHGMTHQEERERIRFLEGRLAEMVAYDPVKLAEFGVTL